MRRLGRRHKVFRFDRRNRPAIKVDRGEVIVVETTDSLDGQFDLDRPGTMVLATSADSEDVDSHRALPMTGPIYVRGAEPGDVLEAEIVGLVATGNGFVFPGFSDLLEDKAAPSGRETVRVVELRRGKIQLDEAIQIPYDLMVGSLGLAPAGDPADAVTPGDYGGNHDCVHLRQGARFYLQVQVAGGLVSLGDVHAAMGDGEVAGTAVECAGEVTLRFHLHTNWAIPGPLLETEGEWMVFGHGPSTDDAIAVAKERAIDLLTRQMGRNPADAHVLLAAAGHLHLNEVVNPNHSARVEMAKRIVNPLPGRRVEEGMERTAVLGR